MSNLYDRDILAMSRYERRERAAIERDQVIHVPLDEYSPGQARYERLMAAIQENQLHQWPSSLVFNV